VHISDTSRFDYLWANASAGACPCAPPCLCNWTVADYAAATASFPTSKFVFVEVDVNKTQWLLEARWVQALADAGAPVGGIVAQPPPGFGVPGVEPATLEPAFRLLASLPLARGIRGAGVNWTDPASLAAVTSHGRILQRFRLSLDVITAVGAPGVAAGVVQVASALPGVRFVLDHVGGPPVLGSAAQVQAWAQGMALVGALPNLYVKVGGVFQDYKASGVLPTLAQVTPFVTGAIGAFGFDRSLFEGACSLPPKGGRDREGSNCKL